MKLVIFDLDDTLINTSDVYYRCREDFLSFLIKINNGYNIEYLRNVFEDIDNKNIRFFGYTPWRYTYSMVEMYLNLVRKDHIKFAASYINQITQIGSRVINEIPPLMPGAKHVLSTLKKKGYSLALLTRGEQTLQRQKIIHHGLEENFIQIAVVSQKTKRVFQSLISELGVNAKKAWSIGDSPKWDIFPAREAGLNTLLVRYRHPAYEWAHEERHFVDGIATVDNLEEIPRILSNASR